MYSVTKSVLTNGCIRNNVKSCEGVVCQFVRYRKPRFKEPAPSKLYETKPRKTLDHEELAVFRQWQNVYNTEMRSVRHFLRKYDLNLENARASKKVRINARKQFVLMQKANAAWNAETAALKEADVGEKALEFEARLKAIEEREERERTHMANLARQTVLQAKENEDRFITPENMDARIEELLSQRSDYDFALFLDGTTTTESFDSGEIKPFGDDDSSSKTPQDAKGVE